MRIAVVGPAPPDRGGIAQQTRLLADHLGRLGALAGYFSYSRRYPRWLDPRRFDLLPEGELPPGGPSPVPLLDYADPSSWRATARAASEAGAGAIVFPWWTAFWAIPARGLFRAARRLRPPVKNVLLVHHFRDHEGASWKRFLADGAVDAADALIVQADHDFARARRLWPAKPALLMPHPVEERPRPDREASRRKLGVTRPLVLMMGLVRRYKGADVLVAAAPRLVREAGAEIAIVGEFFSDGAYVKDLVERSPVRERIRLVDRYVSEAEMDEWLAAADVVACCHRKNSGSGIVARAVAARRPVVASDLPGFWPFVTPESGRRVPEDDPEAFARAALEILALPPGAFAAGLERVAAEHGWQGYARRLRDYCESLE